MTPRYPALVLLRQRPSLWFVNIWADDIYWCMVVQNRDSFVELCQKWNMTVCVLQVSVNRKITLSEHIILILQQREQPRTPLLPAVKKREKCGNWMYLFCSHPFYWSLCSDSHLFPKRGKKKRLSRKTLGAKNCLKERCRTFKKHLFSNLTCGWPCIVI